MKALHAVIVLCCMNVVLVGQQGATAVLETPRTCAIGEWCTLQVVLAADQLFEATGNVTSQSPAIDVLDVRQQSGGADSARPTQRWAIRVLPLAAGKIALPRIAFTLRFPEREQTVETPPASIDVSPEFDVSNRPLEGATAPLGGGFSARELLIGAGALIAAGVAFRSLRARVRSRLRSRRRDRRFKQTLTALDKLRRVRLDSSQITPRIDELSDIVRHAIGQELSLPALAMSSPELIASVGDPDSRTLDRVCATIDPVKYAGRTATADEWVSAVDAARQVVVSLRSRRDRHPHGAA